MKLVLCDVGGNTYGIDIAKVQGIEKKMEMVAVPNASDLVEGIINLRGFVTPIISLHKKFHVEEQADHSEQQYIITRMHDMMVGFRVDAVAEIVEVEEADILPVPVLVTNEDTAYIDSLIQQNGKLVLVLDIECILNEAERKRIAKLVEDEK